jgi:SAM-dependent methyltransferase
MTTTVASPPRITFSFGQNWKSFLKEASQEAFRLADQDIREWLGADFTAGKRVLDIGCGSGIHSLSFFSQGAAELVSFDVDRHSVEATRSLWEKAGRPDHWKVLHGSVLDRGFLNSLGAGAFDLVYAWGVLHHTGAMWDAVANACDLVAPGGLLWLALYVKTPAYPDELALKQQYNRASLLGKKWMVWKWILRIMRQRYQNGQNPFAWNQRRGRGMDVYHDIVDWLGGLPYEVASEQEVVDFCSERGFTPLRVKTGEANNIYLLQRRA